MTRSSVSTVTVIISAFNAEATLPRAIDSVLGQGEHVDVIVVNDGSTDATREVVQKYIQAGQPVVLVDQENSGPGAARNRGLELAHGRFISFLDADDWLLEGALAALLAEQQSTGADVVKGNYAIAEPENPLQPHKLRIHAGHRRGGASVATLREQFMLNLEHCFSWGWLIDTDIAKTCRFPEDLGFMEDVVFLSQLLSKAKSAAVTSTPVVAYFQGEGSLTRDGTKFTRNVLDATRVGAAVVAETPDDQSRTRIATRRQALLARQIAMGTEDGRLNYPRFRSLLSAIRRSPDLRQLQAEGSPGFGFMTPLVFTLLNRTVPVAVAWAMTVGYSWCWRGFKFVRKQARKLKG